MPPACQNIDMIEGCIQDALQRIVLYRRQIVDIKNAIGVYPDKRGAEIQYVFGFGTEAQAVLLHIGKSHLPATDIFGILEAEDF